MPSQAALVDEPSGDVFEGWSTLRFNNSKLAPSAPASFTPLRPPAPSPSSGHHHVPARRRLLTLACRNAVLNMMELLQERGFAREQVYVICSVAVAADLQHRRGAELRPLGVFAGRDFNED
jgi:hypothetical protein